MEYIVIALFLFYMYLSYIYFRKATYRREIHFSENKYRKVPKYLPYSDEIIDDIRWFRNLATEKIELTSFDGLTLTANLITKNNAKRTIILFHGYHSSIYNDFSSIIRYYYKKDYNLLLVNQRAHGESEGRYIGFGALERNDCLLWANYIYKLFGEKIDIYLQGISLGASTVLMASDMELPKNVRGIIADCGFSAPNKIIKKVLKDKLKIPCGIFIPMMSFFSKIFAGFSFYEFSAKKSLKKCKIPVLFIHGTNDKYVPYSMSKENYKVARCEKKLVLVENAQHCMSYLCDKDKYINELNIFFENTKR